MEPIILDQSPLADYLQGKGISEDTVVARDVDWASTHQPFAPSRATQRAISRRKQQILRACQLQYKQYEDSPHCQRARTFLMGLVESRLSSVRNAQFLEKFRYIIIASQLLNPHSTLRVPGRIELPLPAEAREGTDDNLVTSNNIVWASLGLLFALIFASLSPRFQVPRTTLTDLRMFIPIILSFILTLCITRAHFRRRQLTSLRQKILASTQQMLTTMQDFDASASTAILLIQEVELVYRGYSISNALPPISRLESSTRTKRSTQLRQELIRATKPLFAPYHQTYKKLRPFAVKADWEKFNEIHDIDLSDVEDVCAEAAQQSGDSDTIVSIHELKADVDKLYRVRKLFLSTLLAIQADGSLSDYSNWSTLHVALHELTLVVQENVVHIREATRHEEAVSPILGPSAEVPAVNDKTKNQLRKISALALGIREIQAKVRLLREETDILGSTGTDAGESNERLINQYDSIGADLRGLVEEWEQGRALLAAIKESSGHSRAGSINRLSIPLSPSLSLGGDTAVGESPSDAYRALVGHRGRDKEGACLSAASVSSDEQVFEAIALSRPRSTLTREERIAKMKAVKRRSTTTQDLALTNSNVMKELERVIQMRPQTRINGRITSL